jgi:hypothetical protein
LSILFFTLDFICPSYKGFLYPDIIEDQKLQVLLSKIYTISLCHIDKVYQIDFIGKFNWVCFSLYLRLNIEVKKFYKVEKR